jgi:hypothetical protein
MKIITVEIFKKNKNLHYFSIVDSNESFASPLDTPFHELIGEFFYIKLSFLILLIIKIHQVFLI